MGYWSSVPIHVEMRFFVFTAIDFLVPSTDKYFTSIVLRDGSISFWSTFDFMLEFSSYTHYSSSGEVLRLFTVVSLVAVFMLLTPCKGIASTLMHPSFAFF